MSNLGIIILSIIVSVSFISFVVITAMEFNKMDKNPYQQEKK
jgi:hypothetical protein